MEAHRRVCLFFLGFFAIHTLIQCTANAAPGVPANPDERDVADERIDDIIQHDRGLDADKVPLKGPLVKNNQMPFGGKQPFKDEREAVFEAKKTFNQQLPALDSKLAAGDGVGGHGAFESRPVKQADGPGKTVKAVKIAESLECKDVVQKVCKESAATNNFAILECLQNEVEESLRQNAESAVTTVCQNYIWIYKKSLTQDIRFDSAAGDVCKTTLNSLADCKGLVRGKGEVIPCMIENMQNITEPNCKQFVKKMASIVFSDYRLVSKFTDACNDDIKQLECGRLQGPIEGPSGHTQGHTVECLSENVKQLKPQCKHEILRIAELQAEDYHMDRPLFYACRDDRERFCERVKAGSGHVYKCLFKHKFERSMSAACRSQLVRRQRLQQEDVKVNKGFFDNCRKAIRRHMCFRKEDAGDQKQFKMASVLMCLEGALREDKKVEPECIVEMKDTRRALMSDYKISADLVHHCKAAITTHCGGGVEREGKTLHCLMDLARQRPKRRDEEDLLPSPCRRELEMVLREADVGENVQMDPVLNDACQRTMQSVCKEFKAGESRLMECLMEHLGKEDMEEECEERLMEIQYFIARDFKLSGSKLYKNCKKEASELCFAPENWFSTEPDTTPDQGPLIFACLYRHIDPDGTAVSGKLSRACAFEVRRVMRQRAISVELEPRIEQPCMFDLADLCSEDVEKGAEMECLQNHLDALSDDCKEAVEEFTKEEDKDINLDKILMKSCTPMIKEFCSSQLDDQNTEPEDIMECLIKHKNDMDMNRKCAAGIEHHQITNLKDWRFSYKFKEACKQDVLNNCKKDIKKKQDVVRCLSESIRNDTLMENKHRISKDCRRQVQFELLQRSESIALDPELQQTCSFDVKQLCANVSPGKSQITECLKKHRDQISPTCYKSLFQREREEAMDSRTDFLLVTTCKAMIKTYCSDVGPGELFQCLRKHKEEEDFSNKCKRVIIERMRLRSEDVRLNPMLKKACQLDIQKFCEKELAMLTEQGWMNEDRDKQAVSPVLVCLRRKFAQKRLSSDCEDHIGTMIKESAKDIQQDPRLAGSCRKEELSEDCTDHLAIEIKESHKDYMQDRPLAKACDAEIKDHCSNAQALSEQDPDQGHVEECLKETLKLGKITNTQCVKEIVRVISENKADVHVDPLLYRACALDIKHYCADVPRGEGRQMSCLLAGREDKSVRFKAECKKMLDERVQMWEYAAQVAPPDSVQELLVQVSQSPSRNYFMAVFFAVIGCLFLGGLFCGRITKRVTQQAKNK